MEGNIYMEIYKQKVSRIPAGHGWKNHLHSVLCIGGVAVSHADVQRYARSFDVFFVTRAVRRFGVSICFQILEVGCI